jgi:hypothetical protein
LALPVVSDQVSVGPAMSQVKVAAAAKPAVASAALAATNPSLKGVVVVLRGMGCLLVWVLRVRFIVLSCFCRCRGTVAIRFGLGWAGLARRGGGRRRKVV